MVAGTAGDDEDLVDGAQRVVGDAHLVERHGADERAALEERVGDGLGLLVDLLRHEVVVATLLRRLEVPGDGEGLRNDRRAVEGGDGGPPGRQDGQLVVGQREHLRSCAR